MLNWSVGDRKWVKLLHGLADHIFLSWLPFLIRDKSKRQTTQVIYLGKYGRMHTRTRAQMISFAVFPSIFQHNVPRKKMFVLLC